MAELFGADLRSLAVLRIVLALIVLLDVAWRAQDLKAHYSDAGPLPRDIAMDMLTEWRWSLYFLNGSVAFQALLLSLTAAAACAMLVGLRTRTMTIIVWILIVSIQARNPLVLNSSASLLRLLLFWAMFLPLGAWWSLDRRQRQESARPSPRFLSFATVGLFAQIAFMYVFTALLKTGDQWRSDGTALYYVFGARQLTRDLGDFLWQYETLLRWLTFGSLGLELIAPILLFSPVLTGPIRTAALASIMAFQFGIYLTLDIGLFPWTSALCMVCFLPAWFWDHVLPWAQARRHRLPVPRFGLASPAHVGFQHRLFSAFPRVSASAPAATATSPAQRGYVDPVHDEAAGRPALRSSPLVNGVAAACLLLVFGWNLATVSDYRVPELVVPVAEGAGLYQKWAMFAPYPITITEWYVYRGTLADGTEVDLLPALVNDDPRVFQPLSWDEPDDIVDQVYGNENWRKFVGNVAPGYRSDERMAVAGYICRLWNGHYGGDVTLTEIDMYHMSRRTLPDYEQAPVERDFFAHYRCT